MDDDFDMALVLNSHRVQHGRTLPIHGERGTTSTRPTQRVCANSLGERRPVMEIRPAAASYRRDLGDGLIVRWSTMDDAERLAHLFGTVERNSADEPINPRMQEVMRRHVRGFERAIREVL